MSPIHHGESRVVRMAIRQRAAESRALDVLELLASGAAHERLGQLLAHDRTGAHDPPQQETDRQRAVRLGLAIQSQMMRRQQNEARMSALLAGARDVVTADLDGVLKVVVHRTRLLFGFDLAYLGVAEPASREQVIEAADGHTSELLVGLRLPPEVGISGAADRHSTPFWTGDYLTDRRFPHLEHLDEVVHRENMHAILAVPLAFGRGTFGTLFGAYRHTRSFHADEIAAMRAWSELVAAALEKAHTVGASASASAVAKAAMSVAEDRDSPLAPEARPGPQGAQAVGLDGLGELGGLDAPNGIAVTPASMARCLEAALADDEVALSRHADSLLGGEVTVYDADGVPVLDRGTGVAGAPDPSRAVRIHATSATPDLGRGPSADGTWLRPVQAADELLGTVVLRPGRASPIDPRPLLDLVAQVMAVLLLRRREPPPLDAAPARAELLDSLLAGAPRSARKAERRFSALGLDPHGSMILLVVTAAAAQDRNAAPDTGPAATIATSPQDAAKAEEVEAAPPDAAQCNRHLENWAEAYAHRHGGLCTTCEDEVVVLLPGRDAGASARRLHTELSRVLSVPVCVGAAEPVRGVAAIAGAYREARRCARALALLGGGGHGSTEELGFVGLILAERQNTGGYVEAVLGPVLEYDRAASGSLRSTLEAYFAAGGSPTHAAAQLHVHPNTIARRLERISTLIGPDWQQPDRALDLQLALRLLRLRAAVTD
jgi:hypothetical protein